MKYDHVIWDFNGTLLDDVDTGIIAVNKLLQDRGLAQIESVAHYRRVFCFPIIEYYRALGFDFQKESYEELAPQWVSLYLENVTRATLYPDVLWALDSLKNAGVNQTLLSATELSMLIGQIETLGIRDYFETVLGLDNIHAGSKLFLAENWKKTYPEAKAVMIGDTDHDVATAKQLGADCILVCRGHQSREQLCEMGVSVVDSIKEALERFVLT